MYTQPQYFVLRGTAELLTSQVAFPPGSHRLGLALLPLQHLLPSCCGVGDPGERGWVGLELRSRSPARTARSCPLPEQQRLPEAQIIPAPACGITWHIPAGRRSILGGLVQNQRKLHPLLGVLLRRALHSLQNGKHVSPTHAGKTAKLCLSAGLCKAAFREVCVIAAVKKGAALPVKAEGHPRCIFFPTEGRQVSRCMAITKSLGCG